MAKDFREKFDALPKRVRDKIERRAEKRIEEIQLAELRDLADMTQADLAEKLETSQAAVSKLEKQKNITIIRLRKAVEAMGGELDVCVRLPAKKKKVRLVSFSSRELLA